MLASEVAAVRELTQFSNDYIETAIRYHDSGKEKVPSKVLYSDYKKIVMVLEAFRLGRDSKGDGN